jgi:hypothetical protein
MCMAHGLRPTRVNAKSASPCAFRAPGVSLPAALARASSALGGQPHEAGGEEFFSLAAQMRLDTSITLYALGDANRALADLRAGRLSGAAVLVPRD